MELCEDLLDRICSFRTHVPKDGPLLGNETSAFTKNRY